MALRTLDLPRRLISTVGGPPSHPSTHAGDGVTTCRPPGISGSGTTAAEATSRCRSCPTDVHWVPERAHVEEMVLAAPDINVEQVRLVIPPQYDAEAGAAAANKFELPSYEGCRGGSHGGRTVTTASG